MDLTLRRDNFSENGIFGEIYSQDSLFAARTLEHAYQDSEGWKPKVPPGVYQCARGQHQLESMTKPFETFEVTGVAGHTNILFHVGNFNNNSQGCILLGLGRGPTSIMNSREAFNLFLACQKDVDQFVLTIL